MDDSNRKSLIDRYIAAYNAFDVEGMLALLAPDIVFENFSNGQRTSTVSGVDEFRRLAEASTSLFSEREQRITAWRQGPDHAVASIAYRGRLAVDMPDGPPAGTVLELQGESEFAFADGLISRIVDRS